MKNDQQDFYYLDNFIYFIHLFTINNGKYEIYN